jgi:hypothetical protein
MKQYKIEITIREGRDHFWDSIANKTGTDEVLEIVRDILYNEGFDQDNTGIRLVEFTDRD